MLFMRHSNYEIALIFISDSTSSESDESKSASLAEQLAEKFSESEIHAANQKELQEIFSNASSKCVIGFK